MYCNKKVYLWYVCFIVYVLWVIYMVSEWHICKFFLETKPVDKVHAMITGDL